MRAGRWRPWACAAALAAFFSAPLCAFDGAKADKLLAAVAAAEALPRDLRLWAQPHALRRELLCVSLNIFHEARGEIAAGRLAVGLVTRNRADRDGDTLCRVVFAPHQFEWTSRAAASLLPKDAEAWARAQDEACDVVLDNLKDFTGGATHFYAPKVVQPVWAHRARKAQQIGSHRFLRLSAGEALRLIPIRSPDTWTL